MIVFIAHEMRRRHFLRAAEAALTVAAIGLACFMAGRSALTADEIRKADSQFAYATWQAVSACRPH